MQPCAHTTPVQVPSLDEDDDYAEPTAPPAGGEVRAAHDQADNGYGSGGYGSDSGAGSGSGGSRRGGRHAAAQQPSRDDGRKRPKHSSKSRAASVKLAPAREEAAYDTDDSF